MSKKTQRICLILLTLLVALGLTLFGCGEGDEPTAREPDTNQTEEPDTTDEPDTSDESNTPAEPDTQPVEPDNPTEPDTPDEPNVPDEPEKSLVMRVIDVGQGDSILLCCDGEYMLIDSGEKSDVEAVLEQLENVPKLKYLVATHPHTDHMGGVAKILEKHTPELFLMPEKEHTTKAFAEMLDAVENCGCEAAYAYAGDKYTLGGAQITVISPEEGMKDSNLNNWSVVMLVEYEGKRILLTGDAETKMEKKYVKYLEGKVDIFKVAHHGSDTSNGNDLLSVIRPQYCAISCGVNNQFKHPFQSVLDALAKYTENIYRTDLNGDIVFTVKEGKISVTTER